MNNPIAKCFIAVTPICIVGCSNTDTAEVNNPNIVIIYADDMGYGDMSCQNPNSKIQTPNLDQMAAEGVRFSDGHSSSGVSSPSRYAILTGNYHWRSSDRVVRPFEEPLFRSDDELTMASMLKGAGYKTYCVGKWHLGWHWNSVLTPERVAEMNSTPIEYQPNGLPVVITHELGDFDWSKPIKGGPVDRGFDYYFGDDAIFAPPYCWIENDKVLEAPSQMLNPEEYPALEGKNEMRPGPMIPSWRPEDVLPTITNKAEEIISKQSADQPFFLYFSLTAPHTPIIPNDEYHGKSDAGYYGDFVVECDDVVGRVMAALEENGFDKNTIVIFTSDNGPEHYARERLVNFDHNSSGELRGLKRDVYEGGHRVPFIVKWPTKIKSGQVCDEVISQVDLMATFADLTGYELPNDSALDSYSLMPALLNESYKKPLREATIQNTKASLYGIRKGDYIMLETTPTSKDGVVTSAHRSLYNLKEEIAETSNIAADNQEMVQEMSDLLRKYKESGRSVPNR